MTTTELLEKTFVKVGRRTVLRKGVLLFFTGAVSLGACRFSGA